MPEDIPADIYISAKDGYTESIYYWLSQEEGLQGSIRLESIGPEAETLGVITAVVVGGLAVKGVAVLADTLTTYVRQLRADIDINFDGVEIKAKRVTPERIVDLVRILRELRSDNDD
ncbi:MAG TPA: hypothetical protein VMR45_06320 [Patescibacteria group bacterium]|jgi:hypothetical protein|nr:hypothetical protein [Patescibacteria group bacterium]